MARATLPYPGGTGNVSPLPDAVVQPGDGSSIPPPVQVASDDAPKSVLCLDLGTRTGFALHDGQTFSGTVEFRSQRFEGGGMRYLKFRRWLEDLSANSGSVTAVYFEEVRRHVATDAAHVYGGLLATLTAWCEQRSIPYEGVPVGTIKRHVTGKGNADKEAVIAAVRALGFRPSDDNEADALALLQWVLVHRAGGR